MRGSGSTDVEFAEFVAARSTQLYRSAYLLTTSPHAAEDLLQTALAKTFASWRRVRAAEDPVAYVHGVLIKSFLSERRRRSSSELPVADASLIDPTLTASSPSDPTERVALMTALSELAPLDRAVVVLRFWEDRSVAQTAVDLDLTEAAVKNRSLRALRALRELLAEPADTTTSTPRSTT